MQIDFQVLLQLILCCLVPIGVSVGLYLLFTRINFFKKIPFLYQQLIIGVIFGGVAIFGTEVGVNVGDGVLANVRDSAPLCAGLIFGGPAGLIAGIIGGLERFFRAYWIFGANNLAADYTRYACSISTVLAGGYAYFLRRFMFKNERPSWGFGLAIGMIMEVIHLTILFLTKLGDLDKTFMIIKIVAIPMILVNGIALMMSCMILNFIERKKESFKERYNKLTNQVQIFLLITVVIGYIASTSLIFFAETNTAYNDANNLLILNIEDVENDVSQSINNDLLSAARRAKTEYTNQDTVDLKRLCQTLSVDEIDVIIESYDSSTGEAIGTIVKSSVPDNVGYVMNSADQSKEFNCLFPDVGGVTEFVQEARAQGKDSTQTKKYAGIGFTIDEGSTEGNYYLQVAYTYDTFAKKIDERVLGLSSNRHVGNTGRVLVANAKGEIVSSRNDSENGRSLKELGFNIYTEVYDENDTMILQLNKQENKRYEESVYIDDSGSKQKTAYMFSVAETYYVIAAMPTAEIVLERDNMIYLTSFTEILVLALLFLLTYMLIMKLVVERVDKINENLGEIRQGNLDVKLAVSGCQEFISLSNDINSTVDKLKQYIDEAAHRIDEELEFAKSIQLSALPNTYPAFPNIKTFDIGARMYTAKEVGGDFYDYYLLDSNHVGFLVADVSGKGIPAAMFMMQSKALIKNYASRCIKANEVLESANEDLCKENDAGMFVTCWFGIMNVNTGMIHFANAGHNPPLVYRKKTNTWEYLKSKRGLVLAAFDISKYPREDLTLEPGDRLFLYTDGVTEATRGDKVLYGEDRLLEYLNSCAKKDVKDTLEGLKSNIDTFIDGAPQFDDITMLEIDFFGNKENK